MITRSRFADEPSSFRCRFVRQMVPAKNNGYKTAQNSFISQAHTNHTARKNSIICKWYDSCCLCFSLLHESHDINTSFVQTQQATSNTITIKGSTDIVTEFFGKHSPTACDVPNLTVIQPLGYSINSILYQRGIYPPEDFVKVNKYGLGMLVTKDEGLKKYLNNVLNQLSGTSYHFSDFAQTDGAAARVCSRSYSVVV